MARELGRQRHKTVEFWYRHKYNLPATDSRFLDATVEEMMADFFAHTFFDDPKAAEEVVDEDFDPDDVARLIGAELPAEVDAADVNDWEDV